MLRPVEFFPGNFYHIYNRGIDKRVIFNTDHDKARFQDLLYLANGSKHIVYRLIQGDSLDKERGEPTTALIAYALMTNHFHIIAKETVSGGITSFMKKLSTSYSMYFNIKNDRTGALVGRPFKAKHIDNDDYFCWVMSYVHLNPLDIVEPGWKERKARIESGTATSFLKSYRFSSYLDYFGPERRENKIVDKSALPIDIKDIEDFDTMLAEFTNPYERPDIEIW